MLLLLAKSWGLGGGGGGGGKASTQDIGVEVWGHTQDIGVEVWGHTQDIGVEVWGHTQDIGVEVWGHTQDIGVEVWGHTYTGYRVRGAHRGIAAMSANTTLNCPLSENYQSCPKTQLHHFAGHFDI